MSQPKPGVVSRKEAVYILREIFNTDTSFADSLKEQDEYLDIEMLMHKDEPSQLWHAYFVLSLRKILKDLPASTADLRKAVHELLHGGGNAAKGNPALPAASFASPAILSATPRTDVNNNKKNDVNKKRPAPTIEKDDMNTPNKPKRVKTEADATNFAVHVKGPYTVRIFEGDIPSAEFSSSTPATVQVKMVPGSAASAAAVVNCDESDN